MIFCAFQVSCDRMKYLSVVTYAITLITFWIILSPVRVFASSHIPSPTTTPPPPTVTPTVSLVPSPTGISPSPTPTGAPGSIGISDGGLPLDGSWTLDPEVTYIGKMAARSSDFLDWTLREYRWSSQDRYSQPLSSFWVTVRNIVYALFLLSLIVSAFLLIITRGQSVTLWQFLRRFVFGLLLVTLSYSLIQFIYQIGDILQGFFLRKPDGSFITSTDLLSMTFGYKDFLGYRRVGTAYDEAVYSSLLLVKFTAVTYYVMAGVLLLRKIILWFLLIISPVLFLFVLFAPLRNSGRIWIGEFFRWVLYGPLFAVLLSGLVALWTVSGSSASGIPLPFKFAQEESYPTAINILLGGPGQQVSFSNSLNTIDTFALYLVALLMIWIVILLPFILLHVFFESVFSKIYTFDGQGFIKEFINGNVPFLGRFSSTQQVTHLSSPAPSGITRIFPFLRQNRTTPKETNQSSSVGQTETVFGDKTQQMTSQINQEDKNSAT